MAKSHFNAIPGNHVCSPPRRCQAIKPFKRLCWDVSLHTQQRRLEVLDIVLAFFEEALTLQFYGLVSWKQSLIFMHRNLIQERAKKPLGTVVFGWTVKETKTASVYSCSADKRPLTWQDIALEHLREAEPAVRWTIICHSSWPGMSEEHRVTNAHASLNTST